MKYAWIIYSSITSASRIKKACAQKSKTCSVRQTPSAMSASGCNYGIRCNQKDLPFVLDLSKKLELTIKGIYIETNNDTGEVEYEKYDLPR
jgi:Protein of unknown function (DUF3343).